MIRFCTQPARVRPDSMNKGYRDKMKPDLGRCTYLLISQHLKSVFHFHIQSRYQQLLLLTDYWMKK